MGKNLAEYKWDFTPIQYTADDLNFLELRDYELRRVCSAFGVPPEAFWYLPIAMALPLIATRDAQIAFLDEMLTKYIETCRDCGMRHRTLEGLMFCYLMRVG